MKRTYQIACFDHPVSLTHHYSGQHTFSWDHPIQANVRGVVTTINPGSGILQQFPKVTIKGKQPKLLQGLQLELFYTLVEETLRLSDPANDKLAELTMSSANVQLSERASPAPINVDKDQCSLWATPDHVGAMPIHAILLSNTDESLALVIKLVCREPRE